jgi:dephospho-CoA kinase
MLKVGLTGNIGSGKSVVSAIFASLGIPVFHADEESREFLLLPDVIGKVAGCFGEKVLVNGRIDRQNLASVVFGDDAALKQLNSILHPLVIRRFNEWMQARDNSNYAVMEAAVVYENNYENEFDRIIHVSCPEETAISRVTKRDGVSREQVLNRMKHQIKNDDKAARADFVIINNGSHLLIPQVLSIHKQLLQVSP